MGEIKRVYLVRLHTGGVEGVSGQVSDLLRIEELLGRPGACMVIVMSDAHELTIGEYHRLRKALGAMYGEPVLFVY